MCPQNGAFPNLPHFGPPRSQMLDGKGAINFKSNKGLGIAHGGGGDAGQGQESDSSESDDENAVETNGPKED